MPLLVDTEALSENRAVSSLVVPLFREFGRRKKHPRRIYEPDGNPERNQLGFLSSTAQTRMVFGGNQSGKSMSMAKEVDYWLNEDHPYQATPKAPQIYCVSANYRTLQMGLWRHLKAFLPEWQVEKMGPNVNQYQLPSFLIMKNGAQCWFLSGQGAEEARKIIQAAELDLVVVDEEVDASLWEEIQVRLLAREGRVVFGATLVISEPWVLDLEDRAESGDPNVQAFRFSTYRAAEVGHVSKKQIKEIETLCNEDDRAVRLLGKSRRSEALVYSEFGRQHVVEPFPIPKEWARYVGIDPGWRTFAVVFVAVAPDGKYYLYDSIYEHAKSYKTIVNQVFAKLGYKYSKELDKWLWDEGKTDKVEIFWIDPSAFGNEISGQLKVGSLLSQAGLACAPAQNDVEMGIELIRRDMMPGLDGQPLFHVFRNQPEVIKEIRGYRRHKDVKDASKNERFDAPVKRNDHALDAFRYCRAGGLNPRKKDDPYWLQKKMEELYDTPFRVARTPEEWVKNDMRQWFTEQRQGRPAPHFAGLGSEY